MDIERALDKIGEYFPNTPEANLCLAVIERALQDIDDPKVADEHKQSAIQYLFGDVIHAQAHGVSPNLVKSILVEASLMPSEWELMQKGEDYE